MPEVFKRNYLVYAILLLIVGWSFFLYAPPYSVLYNSDNAIHVLMAYHLKLPRDIFYWGQNRLGSLLPLAAHPFISLTSIHPLFAVSIVQYAFILIPVIIISKYLKNKFLVIALFAAIFLPAGAYKAILYVGHPYSAQLLCCTLFIYMCGNFYKAFTGPPVTKRHLKLIAYQFAAMLFLFLSIWASELSFIIVFIPMLYLIFDGRIKEFMRQKETYYYSAGFLIYSALAAFILFKFKGLSTPDPEYDKAFYFESDKLLLQLKLMRAVFEDVILFRDDLFLENLFYYILFVLLIVVCLLFRTYPLQRWLNNFNKSVYITCIIGFIVLFFSSWNLRSFFCPRYYTPLYFLLIISLFLTLDQFITSGAKVIFSSVFVIYSAYYSYAFFHNVPNGVSAWKTFKSFRELPKGTLIAGYWDTYLIGSVAYKNLTPVPFDTDLFRNRFMLDQAMENKRFYLINNKSDIESFTRNDTLWQYSHPFIQTGKKYTLNGIEVLEYRKVR